jgi:hypothetical protein
MPSSRRRRPGSDRLESRRRGNVQDRAAPPFQHAGQQQRRQLRQRRHVDRDHAGLAVSAEPGDGTAGPEAGVVHQDIDVNVPLRQRLGDLASTGRPAQVSGQDLRSAPYSAVSSSASWRSLSALRATRTSRAPSPA